jgi:hypothetical protein
MPNHDRGKVTVALVCVVTTLWLAAPAAHGLSEESWGNDPLPAAVFGDWPAILPVVNHRSRVYLVAGGAGPRQSYWLYYRGNADALNAALRAFANAGGQTLVVIRQGPAEVLSLQNRKAPYDWSVNLVSGPPTQRKFSKDERHVDWDLWPTLTIRPGVNIELDKIQVPPGVTVLHTADLLEHHRKRLKETGKYTRADAARELADIDPYSEQDARAIAGMLDTEDESQMIGSAADALGRFGARARFALPKLRGLLNHGHEHVRERVAKVIETIEGAKEDAEAAESHHEMMQRIEQFVQGLKDDAP